jgi:hypothetical protein
MTVKSKKAVILETEFPCLYAVHYILNRADTSLHFAQEQMPQVLDLETSLAVISFGSVAFYLAQPWGSGVPRHLEHIHNLLRALGFYDGQM